MLRRGITGFCDWRYSENLPEVSVTQFKSACYANARMLGGSIIDFKPRIQVPNFHRALFLLDFSSTKIQVVCNSIYPIVAFANYPSSGCSLVFQDRAELAIAFKIQGFEVASKHYLEQSLSNIDLSILNSAEQAQIKYWQPVNIGEVIYNRFD